MILMMMMIMRKKKNSVYLFSWDFRDIDIYSMKF